LAEFENGDLQSLKIVTISHDIVTLGQNPAPVNLRLQEFVPTSEPKLPPR